MALKTIRWTSDWCGCVVEYQYDDTNDLNDENNFVGSKITLGCESHTNITSAHQLFVSLKNESRMKEYTKDSIVKSLPERLIKRNPESNEKEHDETKLQFKIDYDGNDPTNRNCKVSFKTLPGSRLTATEETNLKNTINTEINKRLDSTLRTRVAVFDQDKPTERIN